MTRVYSLEKMLGQILKPKKPVIHEDRSCYREFRSLCKKHGIKYKVANDFYIDLEAPDGSTFCFGHWADWGESLAALEEVIQEGHLGNPNETWSYFVKEGEKK